MKYLLDTNTCIRYLNGRSPGIKAKLATCVDSDVTVCSIVKAELYFGAAKSRDSVAARANQDTFLARFASLAFDDVAAEIYGPNRAALERLGTPIGPDDLLIASIAIANDLILVTSNVFEFRRVSSLRVEDWDNAVP